MLGLTVLAIALQDLDLEGDWDPEAHDRQMTGIYIQDNGGEFYDEEKPTWDDDINIDDIVPPADSSPKREKEKSKRDRKKRKGTCVEDGGDGVYEEEGGWEDEEWDGTEETRKEKLQEYMDSLLELEFNDVVSTTRSERNYPVPNTRMRRSLGCPRDLGTQLRHHSRSD